MRQLDRVHLGAFGNSVLVSTPNGSSLSINSRRGHAVPKERAPRVSSVDEVGGETRRLRVIGFFNHNVRLPRHGPPTTGTWSSSWSCGSSGGRRTQAATTSSSPCLQKPPELAADLRRGNCAAAARGHRDRRNPRAASRGTRAELSEAAMPSRDFRSSESDPSRGGLGAPLGWPCIPLGTSASRTEPDKMVYPRGDFYRRALGRDFDAHLPEGPDGRPHSGTTSSSTMDSSDDAARFACGNYRTQRRGASGRDSSRRRPFQALPQPRAQLGRRRESVSRLPRVVRGGNCSGLRPNFEEDFDFLEGAWHDTYVIDSPRKLPVTLVPTRAGHHRAGTPFACTVENRRNSAERFIRTASCSIVEPLRNFVGGRNLPKSCSTTTAAAPRSRRQPRSRRRAAGSVAGGSQSTSPEPQRPVDGRVQGRTPRRGRQEIGGLNPAKKGPSIRSSFEVRDRSRCGRRETRAIWVLRDGARHVQSSSPTVTHWRTQATR